MPDAARGLRGDRRARAAGGCRRRTPRPSRAPPRSTRRCALAQARPVPQRPARGQHHPRRRRAAPDDRRLGVRRHGRPALRPRQPVGQQRASTTATTSACSAPTTASRPRTPQRAALKLMRVLSDAREAAWGVVQGEVSELDFDFERLRAASTSSGCEATVARAAASRSGSPLAGGGARVARPRELPDRARVVIIGGGVGGASIAHHLAELGERDVVLLDRNELTSGSTFHSAGLVGQLRSSVSLTRMMMDSVELYRTLDCGWVQCGGIRLACTPEREQEVLRQVAWAKTFGLPLELISAEEAQRAVPADEHRRRALRVLPAERRLPRPVAADVRARRRRARGRLPRLHAHARDGRSTSTRRRACAACRPSGARSRPRSSSTRAACSRPRSAGWPACACRSCPFAHEYLVTQPFRERARRASTCRRCATPTC